MRRVRRGARWTATGCVLVALGVGASGGCIAPPVLLPTPRHPLDLKRFPPAAEQVELPVAPGAALRGVFVPAADPAAPIVVDFLESSGTIVTGARDAGFSASVSPGGEDTPLRDEARAEGAPPEPDEKSLSGARRRQALLPLLGFSSLCVDYAGVGASDGQRSADNLRRDAHAVWDEALKRAGGDPGRLVLHGTSIGALAVAALLQDGARPGAVMLVAPVRGETVVRNGARAMGHEVAEALFGWILREPVDVDLLGELRRLRVPLLVVVPERDDFLRHDERAQLLDAVQAGGGHFLVRHSDHIELSLAARDLPAVERWFLASLPVVPTPAQRADLDARAWRTACASHDDPRAADFEADQPSRARLDELEAVRPLAWPGANCALLAAGLSEDEQREALSALAWLPAAVRNRVDACALASLLALDDPGGRLTPSELQPLCSEFPELAGQPADQLAALLAHAIAMQDQCHSGLVHSGSIDGEFEVERPADTATALAAWFRFDWGGFTKVPAADKARRAMRLVLKAGAVPDRVSQAADGSPRIEVLEAGGWRDLRVPDGAP